MRLKASRWSLVGSASMGTLVVVLPQIRRGVPPLPALRIHMRLRDSGYMNPVVRAIPGTIPQTYPFTTSPATLRRFCLHLSVKHAQACRPAHKSTITRSNFGLAIRPDLVRRPTRHAAPAVQIEAGFEDLPQLLARLCVGGRRRWVHSRRHWRPSRIGLGIGLPLHTVRVGQGVVPC